MSEAGTQVGIARLRAGAIVGGARPAAPAPVDEAAVRAALAEVMDPELPMLSVVDLGIVHRVEVDAVRGPIRVWILPTFVGCPALELIKTSIADRLAGFGRPVEVTATFEVPWTSDRISPAGRAASGRRRDRSAGAGRGLVDGRAGPDRPGAARPVPALRLAADRRGEPVRADPVPDDPLLRGLPPAVRIDQDRLMSRAAPGSAGDPRPVIVGIVGAGTMGAGIAQVALEAGCEVVLYDVDDAALERGRERIRDGLTRRTAKLGLDPDGEPTPGSRRGWTACGTCRPSTGWPTTPTS